MLFGNFPLGIFGCAHFIKLETMETSTRAKHRTSVTHFIYRGAGYEIAILFHSAVLDASICARARFTKLAPLGFEFGTRHPKDQTKNPAHGWILNLVRVTRLKLVASSLARKRSIN